MGYSPQETKPEKRVINKHNHNIHTKIVGPQWNIHRFMINGVSSEGLLIIATEKITITTPVNTRLK